MNITGYRAKASERINRQPYVISEGGKMILCGRAACDVADGAEIRLKDDLIIGANLRRGSNAESHLRLKGHGRLNVNGCFQMYFGSSLEVFDDGELTLGRGYINTGSTIACAKSITLGNGVFIARNTFITDSDHHKIMDADGNIINKPQPVIIGNHVLITYGVVILKGVTIGDGAVIGAGAVVTQDVPAGCLAVGVPAKVIKENVIWK